MPSAIISTVHSGEISAAPTTPVSRWCSGACIEEVIVVACTQLDGPDCFSQVRFGVTNREQDITRTSPGAGNSFHSGANGHDQRSRAEAKPFLQLMQSAAGSRRVLRSGAFWIR